MADPERNESFSSPNWLEVSEVFSLSGRQGSYGRFSMRPHIWRPPTDVFEVADLVVVRIEIAGMKESDFSITLKDRLLVIHGFRQELPEKRAYHQMEIRFGEFGVEVELPVDVVVEKARAEYHNGLLLIKLPMDKPRHIQITSNETHADS
jgi:HSP20 family protein